MNASRTKSRGISILLSLIALSACSTSSFKVVGQGDFRTEIQATPDRIALECEDIKDHENPEDPAGNYGFMIHVLDEENTVFDIIQGNVIGRTDCFDRLKKIEKIIRDGKVIYIGGTGRLDKPRKLNMQELTTFPTVGTFYSNDRVLQFSVIQNERGECYSTQSGAKESCMPPQFPIKKVP